MRQGEDVPAENRMTFKLFLYEGTMTGKQEDFRLYGHSASSTK